MFHVTSSHYTIPPRQVDDADHKHDNTLVDKLLHKSQVLNAAFLCVAFAMMFFGSAVMLVQACYLLSYCLFFKAVFMAYNYSAGFKFKYNCLGEVAVYVIFGPTISSFIYSCLSKGELSLLVIVASSPVGLAITSLVFANNVRDAGNITSLLIN